MYEKEMEKFVEDATSGRNGDVTGFNSWVTIPKLGIYIDMKFGCGKVTDNHAVYACGNHRVVIWYKNAGSWNIPNYVNLVAQYFKPESDLVERPTF